MKEKETVEKFFTALSKMDWKLMNNLYSKDLVYSSVFFEGLDYHRATHLWEMYLYDTKHYSITYKITDQVDNVVTVCWVVVYRFGKKQRKVINAMESKLEVVNGKIVRQTDYFNYKKWVVRAFGLKGYFARNNKKFKQFVLDDLARRIDEFIAYKKTLTNK